LWSDQFVDSSLICSLIFCSRLKTTELAPKIGLNSWLRTAVSGGTVIARLFCVVDKLYKNIALTDNQHKAKSVAYKAFVAVAMAGCFAAAPAFADIVVDKSSQAFVPIADPSAGTTTFTFNHSLGSGSNRLVVCSVQVSTPNGYETSYKPVVTFNGIQMTAIPTAQYPLTTSSTTSKIESDMFYLNDSTLGSASGSLPVIVNLLQAPTTPTSPTTSGAGAICTSFFGVAQVGPEVSGTEFSGGNSAPAVPLSITTTTNGDLVVNSYAGGFAVTSSKSEPTPAPLTPLTSYSTGGILGVSGYVIATSAGPLNLAWSIGSSSNPSRHAQSAAAFAPAVTAGMCNFTANIAAGQGTLSPASGSYPCGTTINLLATPASGYIFTSWVGTGSGYSGSNNSATFTLGTDTTETATFTQVPMCTLTTSVAAGAGTIAPSSSTYICGSQVTVQAFPAAQYVFGGWGGDLSGNTNPAILTLNNNATVTATFNQNTSSVTGDSRGVVEPKYPPVCSVLSAQQVDSSLQEGMPDTARVQAALNACAPGKAVEFSSSAAYNAFIIAPITLPPGVTMLVDPDVTIFGSIKYSDYSCNTSSGWCTPLINVLPNADPAPGSGIMGLGVIDGRGGVPLTDTGTSWWASLASGTDARPRLVYLGTNGSVSPADNFTLYKITLRNSPKFHVSGVGNNLTVWGIRIYAPPDSPNTDGVDPSGSKNITITNSYISDGDDHIAPKAGVAHVSNLTISNNHFYTGHGISVGSETNAGLNNMYVHDNAFDVGATYFGGASAGALRIKSDVSRGGEVHDVLYENTCINNGGNTVVLNPYYSTATGSLIPNFHDITIKNLHQLVHSSHKSTLEGYNTSGTLYPLTLTLDNVVFDSATASDFAAPSQVNNAQITLGPGTSNIASFLQTDAATPTNNITVYNNVSNSVAPLDCSNAFVYLTGDLTAPTNSAVTGQPFTVTALLQNVISPQMSGTPAFPEQNMPSGGTIQLLEGTNVVASAVANGTRLTSITIPSMTTGVHVYTAKYLGDTNYGNPVPFGSITVTAVLPPPVAKNQSVTVSYNTPTPITLSATGPGTLAYSVVSNPAHGTLNGTAPNLTYTPTAGYAGADSFTFKANNGTDSNIATVGITVNTGFTFTPPSGGSTTATVTAGQPAVFGLQFAGWIGATGTVTFSCTGAPQNATCTVYPGTATLTGVTPIPVTVTVMTRSQMASMQGVPAPPTGQGKGLPIAVLAGVFGLTFGLRRKRKFVSLLNAVILCLALSAAWIVTGCGGSSQTPSVAKGTYQLTVTATGAGVTQNVNLTLNVQ
jgi:polygalacturonase